MMDCGQVQPKIADYSCRAVLKDLDGGAWKTRIAEPKQPGFSRWHGDAKLVRRSMRTAPAWVLR